MNTALALALLAGGILLLTFGVNEMNSFSSDVSRIFIGTATAHSIWMTVGGLGISVIGLVFLMQLK